LRVLDGGEGRGDFKFEVFGSIFRRGGEGRGGKHILLHYQNYS